MTEIGNRNAEGECKCWQVFMYLLKEYKGT